MLNAHYIHEALLGQPKDQTGVSFGPGSGTVAHTFDDLRAAIKPYCPRVNWQVPNSAASKLLNAGVELWHNGDYIYVYHHTAQGYTPICFCSAKLGGNVRLLITTNIQTVERLGPQGWPALRAR